VLALMDESYPQMQKGVGYIVAVVVIVRESLATPALTTFFPDAKRKHPFHWHKEGPDARNRILGQMGSLGATVFAAVHYPTTLPALEASRARCIEGLVPQLVAHGVSELLIESRDSKGDANDRSVLAAALASGASSFKYSFDNKQRRVLWLADAACGAVRDYLVQPSKAVHYPVLQSAHGLQLLHV
jgi:hypothetical protein